MRAIVQGVGLIIPFLRCSSYHGLVDHSYRSGVGPFAASRAPNLHRIKSRNEQGCRFGMDYRPFAYLGSNHRLRLFKRCESCTRRRHFGTHALFSRLPAEYAELEQIWHALRIRRTAKKLRSWCVRFMKEHQYNARLIDLLFSRKASEMLRSCRDGVSRGTVYRRLMHWIAVLARTQATRAGAARTWAKQTAPPRGTDRGERFHIAGTHRWPLGYPTYAIRGRWDLLLRPSSGGYQLHWLPPNSIRAATILVLKPTKPPHAGRSCSPPGQFNEAPAVHRRRRRRTLAVGRRLTDGLQHAAYITATDFVKPR